VRVADHAVADSTTEEFVGGNAQGFALDVPQCYVHGRDCRRNGVPGGKEASPEEQLPEVLGTERVFAYEKRLEVLDRSRHRQLAASEPRFADAVDAFVGVHNHDQEVPLSTPHRVGLNAGYLHTYTPLATYRASPPTSFYPGLMSSAARTASATIALVPSTVPSLS
jgi:hypothetical protein